jgi:ABC transporter DrrB family efflux protein
MAEGGMTDVLAALAGRTVRRFFRSPQALVMSVIFPILLLFLLLATFGGLVDAHGGVEYVERLAPLVVLATISFGTVLTGMGFVNDRTGGFLSRVRTMPVPPGAVFTGRLLGDLVRILLVAVLTVAVAHTVGFRFHEGIGAALGFFGVVLLTGAMFTAIAALAGLTLSAAGVQNALNLPTMLLFFLSSGFVPLEAFPAWLEPVVQVNPLSIADEALVGLSAGGPVLSPLLWLLCWSVGMTVVCGALAVRRFRLLTAE